MLKVLLVTVMVASVVALARVPTASATDWFCPSGQVVVDVSQNVVNDVDAGLYGNNWASTSYFRRLIVVKVGPQTYCALSTYLGDFSTVAGLSPGATGTLQDDVAGRFSGRWRSTFFTAKFRPNAPTSGYLAPIDFGCAGTFVCPGFVDWRSLYFSDVRGYGLVAWIWGFVTPENGYWVKRDTGFAGDITSTP